MSQLSTSRTINDSAATHVSDHNQIHTLHDRLDSLAVNVKSYGALGDGSTDDTTSIQNAIAAVAAGTALGTIFFPPGTYIVSGITLPPGITLQGANGQGYYNATTTVP